MIPRLYRPLLLEAWGISNVTLGTAFSAYGFVAMLSYLFGGPLADKFHPRHLIPLSLLLTAMGSLVLAFFPSETNLILTYAFFGASTILLMWGALIKTTHITGGEKQRASAMGALDSGRGLTAALFSSLLIFIIYIFFPNLESWEKKLRALQVVYLTTSGFMIFLSAAIWFALKDFVVTENSDSDKWTLQKALSSLKNRNVWLLSIVVLSSYCGYKSIDNYSIYLVDILKQDLAQSSFYTSLVLWLRPVSALIAGVFADRYHEKSASARPLVLFLLLALSGVVQLLLAVMPTHFFFLPLALLITSACLIYALRAIYFSVFGSLKIKNYLVGTTVGIVSFVGFLPDIFFGYITGRLIDDHPGDLGFKYTFYFTTALMFIGATSSYILFVRLRNQDSESVPTVK